MKAFVLMMVWRALDPTTVPATEEFDTGAACMTRLEQQIAQMMEADGEGEMRTITVEGQSFIIVGTQHYAAWCQPYWLLASKVQQRIEAGPIVP